MLYTKATYIYPPRAEVAGNPKWINRYDNGQYIGQIKYNGSACVVLMDNGKQEYWNRHRQMMKGVDISSLELMGTNIIVGEWLNKNQEGENEIRKGFVIWDILVYQSNYLIGQTFQQRLNLLHTIFPSVVTEIDKDGKLVGHEFQMKTQFPDVYLAASFMGDFQTVFSEAIQYPLYEGLVLKKADAKLDFGYTSANNAGWQVKFRKPTKNYTF